MEQNNSRTSCFLKLRAEAYLKNDQRGIYFGDKNKDKNILSQNQRKVNLLSDKICQERQKHGLSQSELARRSGHAVSTIHGIENGDNCNPSFRLICDIAKVLSISLDELYQDMLDER